ncbi:MAG: hypothetical protein K5647_01835 [Clostridiales bacterium]|nr:hypothetical protein [Clostridiales bacterium]
MKKLNVSFLCLVLVLACAICFSSCTTVGAQGSDAIKTSYSVESSNNSDSENVKVESDDTSVLDSSSKRGTCYIGADNNVFTILNLYDDSTFRLNPNLASNRIPNALYGTYLVDGDKLTFVFEKTNFIGDTSTDLSALKISIVINDDDSLTIIKNETSLPHFTFYPEGDIILTKAEKKAD